MNLKSMIAYEFISKYISVYTDSTSLAVVIIIIIGHIIIIIMYLYSVQYLHILQDSKRYLTNLTVQV